jgi:hypothetical protein
LIAKKAAECVLSFVRASVAATPRVRECRRIVPLQVDLFVFSEIWAPSGAK